MVQVAEAGGCGAPWARRSTPRPGGATPEAPGKKRRHFSAEQKRGIVAAYKSSGKSPDDFCAEQGLSRHSLARWVTAERKAGGPTEKPDARAPDGRGGGQISDSHGVEHPSRRRAGTTRRTTTKKRRRRGRAYTTEERRQAIEAFQASKLTLDDFCRTWG